MKVLIDTNVLVSAALKDKIPEEVILFVVSHADVQWIVSPDILAEYKVVLNRSKFGLPQGYGTSGSTCWTHSRPLSSQMLR